MVQQKCNSLRLLPRPPAPPDRLRRTATTAACRGRKRWILSVPVRGEVWLDEGAQRAVQERKKSLFSAGILEVKGEFEAQVRWLLHTAALAAVAGCMLWGPGALPGTVLLLLLTGALGEAWSGWRHAQPCPVVPVPCIRS